MDRAKLLGFGIDKYTKEEALSFAMTHHGQVVTINPEMINYALKNPYFANIINQAELVIPDGIGVQLGLKFSGFNIKRIAGIEFAKSLLTTAKSIPVALIGAKPDVVEKASKNLKKELPELNLVYIKDGYFKNDDEVAEELCKKQPKIVLVALGSPKQEEFIYKLKSKLPESIMVGVGGSFDVWAGEVKRAPEIWQKLGLEWLYRTIKEPARFKRIFPTLPIFVLKVLKDKWS